LERGKMSVNQFQTLSTLVKDSQVQVVTREEVTSEIEALSRREELLADAGFSDQAWNITREMNKLEQEQITENELKYWQDKGYLVIKIKDMRRWVNNQTYNVRTKTFYTEREYMKRGRFFQKRVKERIPSKLLALIETGDYIAEVPDQILRKAAQFRQEALMLRGDGYPGIQTYILTVIKPEQLKNVASERVLDPLLLYRPYETRSHLDLQGNFVVVGWWGADIEEIEQALGLTRDNYPAVEIHPSINGGVN